MVGATEEYHMAKSGFAKDVLKSFVERILKLEEEKAALADDIKEVYKEAQGSGFDTKIIRSRVVKLMQMDSADRQEADAVEDLYRNALNIGRR